MPVLAWLLLLDVGGPESPVPHTAEFKPTISCKKDSAKQSLNLAAYISLILNNMLRCKILSLSS